MIACCDGKLRVRLGTSRGGRLGKSRAPGVSAMTSLAAIICSIQPVLQHRRLALIPLAEMDHVLIFFSIFLCVSLMIYRTLNANLAIGVFLCACVFIWVDGHFWLGAVMLPEGRNPQIATVGLMLATAAILTVLARCAAREVSTGSSLGWRASVSCSRQGYSTMFLFNKSSRPGPKTLLGGIATFWRRPVKTLRANVLRPTFHAGMLGISNPVRCRSHSSNRSKVCTRSTSRTSLTARWDTDLAYSTILAKTGVAVILFHMKGEDIRHS